jgi:nitroreductase / dihydropteridine reductase
MSNAAPDSFLANLEWRRAVKHFGAGPVDVEPVIRAAANAPSSFGLQPYTIVAVKDKALKERLRPACYGQAQVTECDTLLVFCARTDISARAQEFLKASGAESVRGMLEGFVAGMPDQIAWAARQAYIALGFALAAAAELKIASCPMEGFVSTKVAEELGLESTLHPVVLLALGETAEEDGTWPRFRFPAEELVQRR